MRKTGHALLFACGLGLGLAACDTTKPLVLNFHSPVVVQGPQAFPTTIGPGDSAIVTVYATDPDGDTVVYDWETDCRLKLKGDVLGYGLLNNTYEGRMVVYSGCATAGAAADTGWVSCSVRDMRGGGAYAGVVQIVVQH